METSHQNPDYFLSKSTFVRGCQCPKSLWLYKNKRESLEEENEATDTFFSQGISAGELARDIFLGGVNASPNDITQLLQSVSNTKRYIDSGETIIYEAAFMYDGVFAAIDILVKKDGKWYAYEVKASTKVKDTFIQDAALQYYVIANSGIKLEDIAVIHLNNKYIRNGNLDLNQLFVKATVLEEVIEIQKEVKDKVAELKTVLINKIEPNISIGAQCKNPYPCGFYDYCKNEQDNENDYGNEVIDTVEIQKFLSKLEYPLYFMDFETVMIGIPEHDGHWPYRQVPFQYSVHIENQSGANPSHHQYIAKPGKNPVREFIENLIRVVSNNGSIIVYNKTFENTRLNELKEEFPEYKADIERIQERIIDLMVPFRKKYYYHPDMQGSYSIKKVLPAMLPEYSYEHLEIGNGADASTAYYNLKYVRDKSEVERVIADLFEYCKLDTLAMFEILKKLKRFV